MTMNRAQSHPQSPWRQPSSPRGVKPLPLLLGGKSPLWPRAAMGCHHRLSPHSRGDRLRLPPGEGVGTKPGTVSFQTGNPRVLTDLKPERRPHPKDVESTSKRHSGREERPGDPAAKASAILSHLMLLTVTQQAW